MSASCATDVSANQYFNEDLFSIVKQLNLNLNLCKKGNQKNVTLKNIVENKKNCGNL